jgi:hypothetical protein
MTDREGLLSALSQFISKHGIGVGLTLFLAYEFHQILRTLTNVVIQNQQRIVELLELITKIR